MSSVTSISHHLFVEAAKREDRAQRKRPPQEGLPVPFQNEAVILALEVLNAATQVPAPAKCIASSPQIIGVDSV
jgi:hypothetical protein